MTLERDVAGGRLEVTLPRRWVGRSGRRAGCRTRTCPSSGRGSPRRAARAAARRVVTLRSTAGGRRCRALRADRQRHPGGHATGCRTAGRTPPARRRAGALEVIFYAPVREEAEGARLDWTTLIMRDVNATNDAVDRVRDVRHRRARQQPALRRRRQRRRRLQRVDHEQWRRTVSPRPRCRRRRRARRGHDRDGRLVLRPDVGRRRRREHLVRRAFVIHTAPPAEPDRRRAHRRPARRRSCTHRRACRQRTSGTQDKPMMTIDNSPTSPTFGRLYVVWDEPADGGIIVMSQCDTRPGGVAQRGQLRQRRQLDGAGHRHPTPGQLHLRRRRRVGPDGKVYVVWWDYSATNAIRGVVCDPARELRDCRGHGARRTTIATLDATGGIPLPFGCPIVAQPGGRASTSPQVDVDRSGGPNNNRVYVTWSDLRTGSGSTRCAAIVAPAATHLTFDSFVASAVGALPGSASPVAHRRDAAAHRWRGRRAGQLRRLVRMAGGRPDDRAARGRTSTPPATTPPARRRTSTSARCARSAPATSWERCRRSRPRASDYSANAVLRLRQRLRRLHRHRRHAGHRVRRCGRTSAQRARRRGVHRGGRRSAPPPPRRRRRRLRRRLRRRRLHRRLRRHRRHRRL